MENKGAPYFSLFQLLLDVHCHLYVYLYFSIFKLKSLLKRIQTIFNLQNYF
jgi:hypothetical protein